MCHCVIAHQRWPNAQENLERVWHSVAVISIEPIRHTVDRELPAESDIDPAPVRKIPHITDRVSVDREDSSAIDRIEHQFVPRLLHALEPQVKRAPPALEVRLEQERLCLAVARVVILSPNKRVRP